MEVVKSRDTVCENLACVTQLVDGICDLGYWDFLGAVSVQSYHPDGPMWRTPIPGAAPRVCQGLDMDKVVTYPYIPFWKTREKYQSGYKYGDRNLQPHINAMSPEEYVTYFDTNDYFSKFTYGELLRAYLLRFGRGYIFYIAFPALGGLALLLYFIPSNRFEAIEYYMPIGEYYENYVWHDLGKFIGELSNTAPGKRIDWLGVHLPPEQGDNGAIKMHMFGADKNAYEQYLEARRAKKWGRKPDINPVDYIPLQYRSKQQLGEMEPTEG